MRRHAFQTVDVFTDRAFGGNPLAVFPDATGIDDAGMQALAAEFNLSETAFVLPPADAAHDARVRIFNRTAEMPFAGHPLVGTTFVLARLGRLGGDRAALEVPAGVARVTVRRDASGAVSGATIDAPRALRIDRALDVADVAACAGLDAHDLVTTRHAPLIASVGVDFVIAEVTSDALSRARPDTAAFERLAAGEAGLRERLSLHLYAHAARDVQDVRARMFAPLSGTVEDPATGSANATLAALLLSLGSDASAAFTVAQGVEMGRPSRLSVAAWRDADAIRASVGGSCVPMFEGTVSLADRAATA